MCQVLKYICTCICMEYVHRDASRQTDSTMFYFMLRYAISFPNRYKIPVFRFLSPEKFDPLSCTYHSYHLQSFPTLSSSSICFRSKHYPIRV